MPLRQRDLLKIGGIALASAAVITGGMAWADESRHPVIDRISIPITGLHPALEGLSIVQMSDIHLRPYTSSNLVLRAVEIANGLRPDLIVLTGDYVWRNRGAASEIAPLLSRLNARFGVYSVMGNHDYWLDPRALKAAFNTARLPLLTNQGLSIGVGKAVLFLAGLDDGWSGRPDLKHTLHQAPVGAPVILLLHEPDLADETSLDPRVTLQLSGHTHGGQVLIPGKPPIFHPHAGKKYWRGLHKVNHMWLYTNRGLGTISVPLRINCPPEITHLTLVCS